MFKAIKNFIEKILVSKFVYFFLIKKNIKDGFLKVNKYQLYVHNQSRYLHSLLFWKIYERREVKLIKNYLSKNIPVVELGASLGLTTTTICSVVNNNVKVIAVEANPKIIPFLEKTKLHNDLSNLEIVSAAIDYSGKAEIDFILDDRNLASHKGNADNAVSVKTIKLSDIILKNNIDKYCLICDIEGAEVEMLMMEKDSRTLSNCEMIIMEIHETKFEGSVYRINDIAELVCSVFSMKCIDTIDNIKVFARGI